MIKTEKRKVALLSNVTVNLIASRLSEQYEFYLPEGFDTWVQEVVKPSSGIYGREIDAIIVLLDGMETCSWKNTEEAEGRITIWKQALSALLNQAANTPVFLSTIDFRENKIKSFSERKFAPEFQNDWYQFVQGKAEEKRNVYILDIADAIAEIGRKQFYSYKMWYMSSMPYSRDGLNAVVTEIKRALRAAFESRKKIIALDLDHTLWGGIISEDGIEGIELSNHKEGQRYYDFQHQLLKMKQRGIVLAINSKNNEEEAEDAIQNHPSMLLRNKDFVSKKINWKNKAANIKEMERELNLTEGSFIFIDDNPVERETVLGECPEVTVPEFPTDTSELFRFAEDIWFDYCRPLRVLDEDLKKTEMYQHESKRKQEINESLNLDSYIEKLEMTVEIHRMQDKELERVAQLCNKTNQFNVTTRRYTKTEIEEIAADPEKTIYVVYASDKYGDSGLISVIILADEGMGVRIDTFLMSCRIMGRRLEDVIINELIAKSLNNGKQEIIGEFISTAKNAPVMELYDRLGFSKINESEGHKIYKIKTDGYVKKQFNNYKEIKFSE